MTQVEIKQQTDKRERFTRLATSRTNEVLKRLKRLGNCSNRSLYEFTDDDIDKIFSEIERSLRETKSKFKQSSSKQREFSL